MGDNPLMPEPVLFEHRHDLPADLLDLVRVVEEAEDRSVQAGVAERLVLLGDLGLSPITVCSAAPTWRRIFSRSVSVAVGTVCSATPISTVQRAS